jgi:hypothetical protein
MAKEKELRYGQVWRDQRVGEVVMITPSSLPSHPFAYAVILVVGDGDNDQVGDLQGRIVNPSWELVEDCND